MTAARLPARSEPTSRVSQGEFHPLAAHSTVRDSLPSYGAWSHIRRTKEMPMRKQFWPIPSQDK